jgi:hypothetical protein
MRPHIVTIAPSTLLHAILSIATIAASFLPVLHAATPRVVVTFRNMSLNTASVAPENTEIVKQYGRRLVLKIATTETNKTTSEWVLDALGGEDYVERVEEDALADFAFDDANSDQSTVHRNDPSLATEQSSAPFPMATLTTGWNLDESEPYALHIRSLRLLTDGRGVVMAIVDSGMAEPAKAVFHPAAGYDFISSPDYSNKPNQARNPDYTDPGDQGPTCPTPSWHGTKVASVAAAIAPGAIPTVMRVLGRCGVGFSSDIADAIVWAAGGQINGLSANPFPATVISLSLAGKSPCPSYLQSAVNQARSLGAIIIAAAGNAAQNVSLYFPANCYGVVAVGASTRQGTLATYSNRGVVLSGQGGDSFNPIPVLSVNNGQVAPAVATGTSFSAPHVAGFIALLTSLDLGLDSIVLVPLLGCDGVGGCGGILSSVVTHPNKSISTLLMKTSQEIGVNSSTASASQECSGSTFDKWQVSWVVNNAIFLFDGKTELPLIAGRNQVGLDMKTEELICKPGCYVTSFTVCESNNLIHYIKVTCSDGSSSQKFGQRDWGESCTQAQLKIIESEAGFSGARGIAGDDLNGMELYKQGGDSTLIGCSACQPQTSIQCRSNPDKKNRIITGVWAHFASTSALRALGLTCSVYACPSTHYMITTNYLCSPCDYCGAGNYVGGCGGTNSGKCNACAADCPESQYRANCQVANAGHCAWCGDCGLGLKFTGCPGGGLSDTHGCAWCEAGTYGGGGRSRSCTACEAGKYNPNIGVEASCLACPAGKYSPGTGAVSSNVCIDCSAGKFNLYLGKSSESACSSCTAGKYGPDTGRALECSACLPGEYNDENNAIACRKCPAGTYTTDTASTAIAACTQCAVGRYNSALGAVAECTVCEIGRFASTTGKSSCDRCAAGTYATATGLSACLNCGAGLYSTIMGLSGTCSSCDAGKFSAGAGASSAAACQPCTTGTFGPSAGASVCPLCVAGKYAGTTGKTACGTCEPGSYTTVRGTVVCNLCVAIANCAIGSESTCVPDFGTRCIQCNAIYACVYDSNKCYANSDPTTPSCQCNPGFEMAGGKCAGCPSRKFKSTRGNGACADFTDTPMCVQGKYLQPGTAFANSACATCPSLPSNARQGLSGCEWSCNAGFDNNTP